jgi:Tfp pilus assembly protein PilN
MLVDINLLPKKEPKKFGLIIPFVLLFILIMLVAVYYYFQISSIKTDIDSVDKQISTVRRITAQESEKMNKTQSTNSVTQLKNGIEWADSYRIQSVPVMRELTSLLPERGFIQSFKYEESGMVTLTSQFDTPSEAAYYLDSLNHSKWIEEATLTSLNANKENSSESSTGQSNSLNTPDSSSQNNSTDTTTGAISNGSTSNTNADYLPRYTGQFDIKLNKAMVRKIITETNKDGNIEEGVTAP